MSATIVDAIIEVRGFPDRLKDSDRYLAALRAIRRAKFNGHGVVGVVSDQRAEPTEIPCWGHDYRCDSGGCAEPLPWGARRWFGTSIVVDGEATAEIMGTYMIGSDVRVELCGVPVDHSIGTIEVRRIDPTAPELRAAIARAKGGVA